MAINADLMSPIHHQETNLETLDREQKNEEYLIRSPAPEQIRVKNNDYDDWHTRNSKDNISYSNGQYSSRMKPKNHRVP